MPESGTDLYATTEIGPVEWSYSERDVILYNLSLGCTWHEQRYVNENHADFAALPTLAVIPPYHDVISSVPLGDVLPKYNPALLLHGEQYLEMHAPMPRSGRLLTTARVLDTQDKAKLPLWCAETGKVIAENEVTSFNRGAGGFGKRPHVQRKAAAIARNTPPERPPDEVTEEATSKDLAALYRLNGDYNPLHIDPEFAALAGFDRPILHGLCSFGVAAKHVLKAFADGDPAALKSVKGRFAKHVFPGETLRTEMWVASPTRVIFQTRVLERDALAITNAAVELFAPVAKQHLSRL